jgi:uncharacterized protein
VYSIEATSSSQPTGECELMADGAQAQNEDGLFQILVLDGGGLKGIYSAAVLAALEEDFGTDIRSHFDLIVGTSTGGILALGLAAGLRPHDMSSLYIDNARRIFPERRFHRTRRFAFGPYQPAALQSLLSETFGQLCLGDSPVRLAIPSFDLTASNVHLFRTAHHARLRRDYRELFVDVALATSAAPTYLPAHQLRGLRLIDGGVWANNPTMVGVIEALTTCEHDISKVRVLNIGTTNEVKSRSTELDVGSMLDWRNDALDVALTGQALASVNHSGLLLGKDNLVRIDVPVPVGLHHIDVVKSQDLMGRAESSSRTMSHRVESFIAHIAAPYRNFARKVA